MIALKRVYDKAEPTDGTRFLVERLWPRGIRKTDLPIDSWIRDVAPSDALRRWFAHDPAKWKEFRRLYFEELDRHPQTWEPILSAAKHGKVTFIYSAHDPEYNNAVALREYLQAHMSHKKTSLHA